MLMQVQRRGHTFDVDLRVEDNAIRAYIVGTGDRFELCSDELDDARALLEAEQARVQHGLSLTVMEAL